MKCIYNSRYDCHAIYCPMMYQPINSNILPDLPNYNYTYADVPYRCDCIESYRSFNENPGFFYMRMRSVPFEEIED